MRPPIIDLGNYLNFESYKSGVVVDVFGNEVIFGNARFNGSYDCHHVCFGGSKANWSNPTKWERARAERILWIGPALSDPGIKVYQDPGYLNRRRYLLVVDADPQQGKPTEYFCVIAEVINAKKVAFITAYDISRETWEEYKRVGPRYYPLPNPGEANKKKKKKGTA